jgi:uncharacterized membrane protein
MARNTCLGAERQVATPVTFVAVAAHRPLARAPENTLKLAVGVVISGFGIFWTGEGLMGALKAI